MIDKQYLKSKPGCRVTFMLPEGLKIKTAQLVGDFNDWDITATPMSAQDDQFQVTLELETGQEYQFRYLINDQEWYNDWNADKYVPNPFGGDNSVVVT